MWWGWKWMSRSRQKLTTRRKGENMDGKGGEGREEEHQCFSNRTSVSFMNFKRSLLRHYWH